MEILNKVRNLDAPPKINNDFYNRTLSGLFLYSVTKIKLIVIPQEEKNYTSILMLLFLCLLVRSLFLMLWISVRHDIVKKRLDHLGNVIESRWNGIGAPKIGRPLKRHGVGLITTRPTVVLVMVQKSLRMTALTHVKGSRNISKEIMGHAKPGFDRPAIGSMEVGPVDPSVLTSQDRHRTIAC